MIFNATDFGAAGDGVTDDRAAIQAALDAAGAAGGGTVQLAAGTFYLGNALAIPSNVVLAGAGSGTVLLTGPGDPGINVGGTYYFGSIVLAGVTGAGVQNLTLDLASNSTHTTGILLDGASQSLIDGLTIDGSPSNAALIHSNGGSGNTFSNNTLVGGGAQDGVEIIGGQSINITGNSISGLSSRAVFLQDTAGAALDGVVIRGNALTGNGSGIQGYINTSASGLDIAQNTISASTNKAIFIASSASATVDGTTIADNQIDTAGEFGIWLSAQGGHGWTNTTVNSNTIDTVTASYGTGISVDADNVTVSDNTVTGAAYTGISVASAANVQVAGNNVTDSGAEPILIDAGSTTGSTLEDNTAPTLGDDVPSATLQLGAALLDTTHPATSLTVAFSAPVVGFSAADLSLPAGVAASDLASADGGITWTGTLVEQPGAASVSGAVTLGLSGAWLDAGGNPVSYTTSTPLVVHSTADTDTLAPHVVSIGLTASTVALDGTIGVSVVFSEAVKGFDASDLVLPASAQLTPAGLASLDGGVTWQGSIIAGASINSSTGPVSVSGGYTDLAGNAGAASDPTIDPTLEAAGGWNVKTLGAKADGVTDDLAVIQAALDAAGAAGGGTVYLPAGVYFLSNMLLVPSHVTLEGAGADTILRTPAGALPGKDVNGVTHFGTIGLIGVTDATVRNLALDDATNGTHANGVILAEDGNGVRTTNSLVEGVTIYGFNDHSYLIWNYQADDNIIRNNTLYGNVAGGPSQQEGIEIYGGHNVLVEGNTITDIGNNALYAWEDPFAGSQTDISGISFLNNTVVGGHAGVNIYVNSAGSGFTVQGNSITDTTAKGIYVSSAATGIVDNALITGNTITGTTGLGVWLNDQGSGTWSNVDLSGNTIDNSGSSFGTGVLVTADNVNVANNVIAGATYSGVYIRSSANDTISDNQITDANLAIYEETYNSTGIALSGNDALTQGASPPTVMITLQRTAFDAQNLTSAITIKFSTAVWGLEADNLVLPAGLTSSPLVSTDGGITWTGTLTAALDVEEPVTSLTLNLDQAWVDADGNPVAFAASVPLSIATVPGVVVSGNGLLTGGAGPDTLIGGSGNDTLDGGIGADSMAGGGGNDTYVVDNPGDVVQESAGQGYDTVLTSVGYTLPAGDDIEAVVVITTAGVAVTGNGIANTLTGNAGNDTLDGGGGDDTLYGNGGNDVLTGGAGNDYIDGGPGIDTMSGGAGDDTYVVDNAADVVNEAVGGGSDTVLTSVSYTLAHGQEIETLEAYNTTAGLVLTGNEFTNHIIGGSGNDTLFGGPGNDLIEGGDGNDLLYDGLYAYDPTAGVNTLAGGAGNDIYYVNNPLDKIIEAVGGGIDILLSAVNYVLTAGQEVENMSVLVSTGTSLTGNEFAQTIRGNAGNDTLIGGGGNDTLDGGAGADSMVGGTGDDTYYIDNPNDIAVEAPGEGNDIAYVSSNWVMTAGSAIETVQLTAGGTSVTGNALDNHIIGSSGSDTIYGGAGNDPIEGGLGNDSLFGGPGNDTLIGGAGNDRLYGDGGTDSLVGGSGDDIYYITDSSDIVDETGGGGNDLIMSRVNYLLAPGQAIENMSVQDATALSLTGNEFAQTMRGNVGNDTLIGGGGNDTLDGGAGADSLAGGTGDDVYYVDNPGDIVVEAPGEGNDLVYVSSNWTVTAGSSIETVRALVSGLAITGNDLGDILYGTSGSDTLTGGAGNDLLYGQGGADLLAGGAGNDVYYVTGAGTQVLEAPGGGFDVVQTTVDFTIGAGQEVESVQVTSATGRAVTGNELANELRGGSGNDTLIGGGGNDDLYGNDGNDLLIGGPGNDRLTGGAGADRFVFATDWGSDLITDLQHGVDIIDMTGVAGLTSFAQLSVIVVGANDIQLGFGANKLQILGDTVTAASLQSDIVFKPAT